MELNVLKVHILNMKRDLTQQPLLPVQEKEVNNQNQQMLQHNIEEEEEIAQQDLTKEEMESIQAQLNAMQQQRSNA